MDVITAVLVVCAVGGLIWAITETITNIAIYQNTKPMRKKLDQLVPAEEGEKSLEQILSTGMQGALDQLDLNAVVARAVEKTDIKGIVQDTVNGIEFGSIMAQGVSSYIQLLNEDQEAMVQFYSVVGTSAQHAIQAGTAMYKKELEENGGIVKPVKLPRGHPMKEFEDVLTAAKQKMLENLQNEVPKKVNEGVNSALDDIWKQ